MNIAFRQNSKCNRSTKSLILTMIRSVVISGRQTIIYYGKKEIVRDYIKKLGALAFKNQ
jgi:hypothetical protein